MDAEPIDGGYNFALTFPNGFRGDSLDEELVVLLKQAEIPNASGTSSA